MELLVQAGADVAARNKDGDDAATILMVRTQHRLILDIFSTLLFFVSCNSQIDGTGLPCDNYFAQFELIKLARIQRGPEQDRGWKSGRESFCRCKGATSTAQKEERQKEK